MDSENDPVLKSLSFTVRQEMQMHSHRLARSTAFTLLELLVVVSIIALLMGLLVPAITKARESARRAKCMSNIHQLSVAMLAYANDNDGNYPNAGESPDYFSWSTPGYNTHAHPWLPLQRYIDDTGVLYCPSALYKNVSCPATLGSYPANFQRGTVQPWSTIMNSDTHYGYMQWMTTKAGSECLLIFESPCLYGHQIGFTSTAFADAPAALLMGSGGIFTGTGVKWWGLINSGINNGPFAHDVGSNAVFVDGHSEWQINKWGSNVSVQWMRRYDDCSPTLYNNGYGWSFVW